MKNFWSGKNILITGHTGFKGSWLALYLKSLDSKVHGISLTKKEGIYELSSVNKIMDSEYFLDISEKNNIDVMKNIIKKISPDIIFHFAAQSLVLESYKNPIDTISTNILGPVHLITAVKNANIFPTLTIATTDKVYSTPNSKNTEEFSLGGKDFYSASKVSKEFIIDAFRNHPDYSNIILNKIRSGNVIGGGDRAKDRLFTDLICSINANENIILRNPDSVRPWQYVLDSLKGYLLVTEKSYLDNKSFTYNLNSDLNNKYTVYEIAKLLNEESGLKKEIIVQYKNTFNEVDILTIDSSAIKKDLGWSAKHSIPEIIKLIVDWEFNHKTITSPDYSLREVQNFINV
ncbi:CDP-glucose 4,6-dehydratase [Acidimicrobiia bacterium]|nr:CDP-glucose 4,6-dehydratase [Acidimicrobiia bacterium]